MRGSLTMYSILFTTMFYRSQSFISRNCYHSTSRLFRKKQSLTMKKKNYLDMEDIYKDFQYEFCQAKNDRQQKYIDKLNDVDNKILFAIGPAGTGKTMIACNHAIKLLKANEITKVIITRPIVPVEEEEHGFLPGSLNKKMNPWTRPIFDIFLELYTQTQIDRMIFDNIIEIAPLAFMRGRTFKNTLIIADEMQNSTPNQMKMLLTRIGTGSKLIVTGDINQNDISGDKESGLSDIVKKTRMYKKIMQNKYENYKDSSVDIIEFRNSDIERSKVIKKILDIYSIEDIISSHNGTTTDSNINCDNPSVKLVKFPRPVTAYDTEKQNNEFSDNQ